MRLRHHLTILVLATLVPVLGFAAFVIRDNARLQREATERGMRETARAIALTVDKTHESTVTTLQTLADSEHLDTHDLVAFHTLARRVVRTQEWSSIRLFDPNGAALLSTSAPLGATLPPTHNPEAFAKARDTRHAAISNLFDGLESSRLVAVHVPVVREKRVPYVIAAAMSVAEFSTVLRAQTVSPGWIVGLQDRDAVIVARTQNEAEMVGRRIAATPSPGTEGWLRSRVREGTEVYIAYATAPLSGWRLVLIAPADAIDAPLRQALWRMLAGAAIAALLAGILAVLFGRRIADAAAALMRIAHAVEQSDRPAPLHTGVAELNRVGDRLRAASELVRAREQENARLLAREHAARGEAETANRGKDEFLAMLGHELRNPLSAIASAVRILEKDAAPETARAGARQVIARQTDQLRHLVDDLLDVARVTSGKIVLDRRPADLAEIVRRCVATVTDAGGAARHDMTVDVQSAWAMVDETRAEQIVMNLVGNALKYTPPGGRVHVTLGRVDDDVVLRVTDTGIGIAPEVCARVFDLFVQLDRGADRRQGGLGVGLTLVRRLAELHGGRVDAASDGVGKGSTFTVRVPAMEAPAASGEPLVSSKGTASPLRIVVVEDNADARGMLASLLRLSGHEVHDEGDGTAGLATIRRLVPDVAFIDVGLPGLDGYELVEQLRAESCPTYCVALTGYGQPEDRRRALSAGFHAHVVKPVNTEELLRLLEGLASGTR